VLPILLEILNRLRVLPGLGFLHHVYEDLRSKQMRMEIQAKKLATLKKRTQTNLKDAAEIPSVLKGSKKRA